MDENKEKADKADNEKKKDVNDPDNNVQDPDDEGTGLGLASRSGSETELGGDDNADEDDKGDPTVRLKRKEDLRRGLNQSNPNNMNNNSNSLLDNE